MVNEIVFVNPSSFPQSATEERPASIKRSLDDLVEEQSELHKSRRVQKPLIHSEVWNHMHWRDQKGFIENDCYFKEHLRISLNLLCDVDTILMPGKAGAAHSVSAYVSTIAQLARFAKNVRSAAANLGMINQSLQHLYQNAELTDEQRQNLQSVGAMLNTLGAAVDVSKHVPGVAVEESQE